MAPQPNMPNNDSGGAMMMVMLTSPHNTINDKRYLNVRLMANRLVPGIFKLPNSVVMSAADGHSVYTASAPLPRKRSMNSPSTLESPTNDSPGDNKDTQDLNDGDAGVHINTSQLEYSPNSYSTPETRPCGGTKEVTHDHSVEDNSSPYNDRVHLLRLLPDMLPLGLQNRTSKMSEATRFHHWPTVLYSNVEELMSDLSPSEQNIFRTQRGHILHPFSGAKMFARLFSGRGSLNILGLECTSLDDMKNDGTDDIINFENIGGWEASADSLINNRSLVGGEFLITLFNLKRP